VGARQNIAVLTDEEFGAYALRNAGWRMIAKEAAEAFFKEMFLSIAS